MLCKTMSSGSPLAKGSVRRGWSSSIRIILRPSALAALRSLTNGLLSLALLTYAAVGLTEGAEGADTAV